MRINPIFFITSDFSVNLLDCTIHHVEKFGHCLFVQPNQDLLKLPKFLGKRISEE